MTNIVATIQDSSQQLTIYIREMSELSGYTEAQQTAARSFLI